MVIKVKVFPRNVTWDSDYINVVNWNLHRINGEIDYRSVMTMFDENYDTIDLTESLGSFPFNDGVNTSLAMSLENQLTYLTLTQSLNANYMHVKIINDSGEVEERFYFITGSQMLNSKTIVYQLKLDLFTTYAGVLQQPNKTVMVGRKHCNRYYINDTGKLSPLNQEVRNTDQFENMYQANICTKELEPTFNFAINKDDNEKLNQMIWAYVFFSDITEQDFPDNVLREKIKLLITPMTIHTDNIFNTGFEKDLNTNVYCMAYPVGLSLQLNGVGGSGLKSTTIGSSKFLSWASRSPSCIGIVYSWLAPFRDLKESEIEVSRTNLGKFNFKGTNTEDNGVVYRGSDQSFTIHILQEPDKPTDAQDKNHETYLFVRKWNPHITSKLINLESIDINKPTKPSDKENNLYEPKLLKSPYYKLLLKSQASEGHDYDYIYANYNDTVQVDYYETISPFDQSYYINITSPKLSSPYNIYKDLHKGVSGQMTYTSTLIGDKLRDYIAQNKNYKSSAIINATSGLVSNIANMGTSLLSGIPKKAAIRSAGGLAGGIVHSAANLIEFGNKIDDLDSAPDYLRKSGGDIYYDIALNNIKPKIFVYELFDTYKEQVADYYRRNGYIDNTFETMDFTDNNLLPRCNYNYLKLNDNDLRAKFNTTYLSDRIVNEMSNILNRGLTFWNVKYFLKGTTYIFPIGDYSKPNWEKNLF